MTEQKPTHVVTGSVATVTVANELRYLYKGAPVPVEVPEAHLAALVDLGLVSKIADVKKATEDAGKSDSSEIVIPDGDPADVDAWTIKALKQWGADNGIEIPSSAKAKADIVKVLLAAKAERDNQPPANPAA